MKIRELVKLRKQNDRVKLAFLFILAGVVFFGICIRHGISCLHMVNGRTEYVLSAADGITGKHIDLLSSVEEVSCVSRTLEENITIQYRGKEAGISCTLVSREYIEELYGIECRGSGKVFYMNQAALGMMNEELGLPSSGGMAEEKLGFPLFGGAAEAKESFEIKAFYLPEGEEEKRYREAVLIVLPDTLHGEEPFVCSCDSTARLLHGTASVRVIRGKRQIEDMAGAQFEKMGFQVEEKERLMETAYEVQLSMVKLEYSILLAVVCLLAGFLLYAREIT